MTVKGRSTFSLYLEGIGLARNIWGFSGHFLAARPVRAHPPAPAQTRIFPFPADIPGGIRGQEAQGAAGSSRGLGWS